MKWQELTLKAAAIYNIAFGAWAIFFPLSVFDFLNLEHPIYPQFWQCIGMIVGVYGVGYWIASTAPSKHYPIVLVGLLGKVFGPIGFVTSVLNGSLPTSFGYLILTNDLIWWIPFFLILKESFTTQNQPQITSFATRPRI